MLQVISEHAWADDTSADVACRLSREAATTGGAEVILTPNEVEHARKTRYTALFIVSETGRQGALG
jgi:hypothetical protein